MTIRHPPDFGGTFLTTSEKTLYTRELVVQTKCPTLFSDIIMIHNIHHNIFHSDYGLKDENATQPKLYQFRTPFKDVCGKYAKKNAITFQFMKHK